MITARKVRNMINQMAYYCIDIYQMKWIILLAVLATLSNAVDDGDWVDPFTLPLNFTAHGFYAGYLKISAVKSLYYVYTPSQSNPGKDPLVAIISPGPGCSALHGWLYSKSEFTFTRNTTNFRINPHNWNKQANVLYIEGPVGVGFTIGSEVNVGDDVAQQEYFYALLRFYEKFSELKDQKLYLSGYGYAGIIAPKLALNILKHNQDPQTVAWLKMNLAGMILFNPCTLAEQCDSHFEFNSYTVKALRDNYFISKEGYEEYQTHCTLRLQECDRVEQKISSNFRITGADLRNLYQPCLHQPGDYGCIDHIGIDIFLNSQAVKEDLNADTSKKWDLCNSTLSEKYVRDPEGSLKDYESILRAQMFGQNRLRVWIVSGTQSAFVPTWGTKRWIDEVKMNLGLPSTRLWEPWFYKNNINVGQIQQMPGLTLVTIRSAGFWMFEDQPEISEYVYSSYLSGATL